MAAAAALRFLGFGCRRFSPFFRYNARYMALRPNRRLTSTAVNFRSLASAGKGAISDRNGFAVRDMPGHIRLLLAIIGVSLVWVLFAKLVVPPFIEAAYRGDSWPLLNRMILGQAHNPVEYYLRKWDRLIVTTVTSALAFYVIALVISRPAVAKRIVGEATPGTLGAIRMWTCAILLFTTLWEDVGSIAWLPLELRHARGMLRFLYLLPLGFDTLLTSETSLRAFQLLTEALLFLGAIGWRTRVVLPAATFCHFVLLGFLIDYSFFWHQNLVPLYVMLVLCLTPSGDGWSVDRLLKISRGQSVPDAERASSAYGWARYACWAMIALPYVANGLSKLVDGGLLWWDPTSMRAHIYGDTLNPREWNWALGLLLVRAPDVLVAPIGIFAMFSETLFGLVLVSRTARRVFPPAAMMMHIGIFLLQRILFLDLILLQLVFFNFTPIRKAIGAWLKARRGRLHVLYDGACPLCRRTVGVLSALDLFGRLEFLDFRRLDLDEYNHRHRLELSPAALEQEMTVVVGGRRYDGFQAYRRLALALPALWPLAPWLFLPGVSGVGARLYRYVAANRLAFVPCDTHCATEAPETAPSVSVVSASDRRVGFGYAMAVSFIIIGSLLLWHYRVEFYPLTSWHLYANRDTTGRVEYAKIYAVHDDGQRARTRLEDAIGALALDGRYSPHFEKCFSDRPTDLDLCKRFLTAAATGYNKRAQAGKRITQYEIERWGWDFRDHPLDTNYGTLFDRVAFSIGTGQVIRERVVKDGVPPREPVGATERGGETR
jgi:predicted DCC family thiol-disulfide oxidoreductase YuxK